MKYTISTDKSKLNVTAVHDYLCNKSYSTMARLAEVLDMPVPYFYAADDQIAEALSCFYQLKARDKSRIFKELRSLTLKNKK